jgi:2-C-methyl-D-erythritol 4-phosphate cytidylyltransferase
MPRYFAIVPAAGSGSRFGAEKPKQYLDLLGRPLIFHTLAALTACPEIERVWVVLAPDDPWGRNMTGPNLGPSWKPCAAAARRAPRACQRPAGRGDGGGRR